MTDTTAGTWNPQGRPVDKTRIPPGIFTAAFNAAFPGLPQCMTLAEAERRVAAALNAAWPLIELRAVLAALDEHDDHPITDSLTYVTIGEDAKTTALRDEIMELAKQRDQAISERDLWEARTRKLLAERHGRLTLDELDAARPPSPCAHTWNGRIDASETGVTIHLSGHSGGGKLLAAHARARDLAADLANAIDEAEARADARAEGW